MHLDTERVVRVSQGNQAFTIGNLCPVTGVSANQNFAKFCIRKFEFSDAFSCKKMRSLKSTYGVLVAENDDLPGVLNRAVPASLEFLRETLSSDEAVYVPKFSTYHMAVSR